MTAPLCDKCRNISFDALRGEPGFSHNSFVNLELETVKNTGGPICCLLWRALSNTHNEPFADPNRKKVLIMIDDAVRLSLISGPRPAWSDYKDINLGNWQGLLHGIKLICGQAEVLDRLRWNDGMLKLTPILSFRSIGRDCLGGLLTLGLQTVRRIHAFWKSANNTNLPRNKTHIFWWVVIPKGMLHSVTAGATSQL
jgi:hypothetical protein